MDASKEDLFVYNVLVHACIYCATDKNVRGKLNRRSTFFAV